MRLSVQNKLLAGFIAVLALMGVIGWIGITNLGSVAGLMSSMYDDRLVPIDDLGAAATEYQQMRVNVLTFLVSSDKAAKDTAETSIAKHEKTMLERIDKYSKTSLVQEEKDNLAKFNAAWAAYKVERDKLLKLSRDGDTQGAMAILNGSAAQARGPVEDSLNKLIAINEGVAKEADAQGAAIYENSRALMLGAIAIAILLGLGIALFLARSIAGAVGAVAKVAKEIAEVDLVHLSRGAEALAAGDLSQTLSITAQPVNVKSSDEIGEMARSFNDMIARLQETGNAFGQMTANLRETIGTVASAAVSLTEASQQLSYASEQTGAATQQIATTIQQVAKGNQDQSASVQETTASVEQLTQAINQIAKGSQEQSRAVERTAASAAQLNGSIGQANAASKELSAAGEEVASAANLGAKSVQNTADGMTAIKDSTGLAATKIQELGGYSEQIGTIVETIDDIAEQTNLLALNAAIEAARAGEHGRGIAVVADEVRKLAERSGKSTKEIADLIAKVQRATHEAVSAMDRGAREVESGAQQSQQSAEALQGVMAAAERANREVSRIASALLEMEEASTQVVGQMDAVSAVVEETTASTQEMAASSQQVTGAVEKIAAVSEETSASAEEVSAPAEEMSSQVEEMVAQAQELAQMAEELQAAVAQFKLGDETGQSETVMRRRKDDWSGVQLRREADGRPRLASISRS